MVVVGAACFQNLGVELDGFRHGGDLHFFDGEPEMLHGSSLLVDFAVYPIPFRLLILKLIYHILEDLFYFLFFFSNGRLC